MQTSLLKKEVTSPLPAVNILDSPLGFISTGWPVQEISQADVARLNNLLEEVRLLAAGLGVSIIHL